MFSAKENGLAVNTVKLHQIAEVSTGYSFREQIKNDSAGDTKVIHMSDVDRYQGILTDQLKSVRDFNPRSSHYFLNSGDIILVSKGYNIHAHEIPPNLGKVVPVNSFSIIKLKMKEILPGYLTWFLNSPRAQHYFESVSMGTNIPNVTIEALEGLEVKMPPLTQQEMIARVAQLKLKEIRILKKLSGKKELYVDALLGLIVEDQHKNKQKSGSERRTNADQHRGK